MLNKAFNLQKKSAYAHTLNSIPVLMVAEISLSTLFGYSFYSRKLRNLGRVIIWPDFIIINKKIYDFFFSQVTFSKWTDESFEILSKIGINLFTFWWGWTNWLLSLIDVSMKRSPLDATTNANGSKNNRPILKKLKSKWRRHLFFKIFLKRRSSIPSKLNKRTNFSLGV